MKYPNHLDYFFLLREKKFSMIFWNGYNLQVKLPLQNGGLEESFLVARARVTLNFNGKINYWEPSDSRDHAACLTTTISRYCTRGFYGFQTFQTDVCYRPQMNVILT